MNKHWFSELENVKELQSIPNTAKTDILDEIMSVISVLRKRGFARVVVVDLTRREVGVPTVRVIAPSLEVYGLDADRVGSRGRRHVEDRYWQKK